MRVRDLSQIERDILTYLSEHPDAQDTIEGIVEWWLLEQEIKRRAGRVKETLTELVAKRLLLEQKGTDARVRYKLNAPRRKEINALLKSIDARKECSMTCTITNQARRIVSFRSNSGQTWHLPPNATVEIMEVELADNAKIHKLAARGILTIQPVQKAESAPSEKARRLKSQ